MITLLALLTSCQGLSMPGTSTTPPPKTVAEVPPVVEEPPAPMPGGQLVVRECYGGHSDEYRYRSSAPSSGYGSGGGGRTSSTAATKSSRSAAPMATAPKPAAAPVEVAAPPPPAAEPAGVIGGMAEGDAAAARPMDKLADASAPMPDTSAARGQAAEKKDAGPVAREMATQKGKAEAAVTEESERMAAPGWRPEPVLDWGATVYLSNDDSMSLASAQRLLWAVQKRGPVTAAQVRPHELLNYFSFETAPVAKGDTFSVLGSATQTDADTLTMAFAVKGVTPKRKPLDLTMVLDRSGSMTAEGRMEYLKRGLLRMTENLERGDRIDLVLFDDEVCTPVENFVVGRDDMGVLTDAIGRLAPRGSTDLDAGLREGYRIAEARTDIAGRNRRMMLISDALLNTGNIDPNTVTQVAKAYEAANIRLTAIGVGRDFNDKVLDMLTEKGKGAYVYLGSEAVVDRVFGVGFQSLTQTIAHDVRFSVDLPPSLAMERFYGEEMSTNPEDVQPINYYAGTTQLFLQDLTMRGRAPVASDPVTLRIEYTDVDTGTRETQDFHTTVGALVDGDHRNLDKGRALMAWTDLILARSLGNDPCGAPFSTWQARVATLGEDAEVGWLDGLTSPLCGQRPVEPVARVGVPYKVKVDSDMPIAEVAMACGGWQEKERLTASDTVATFSPSPGAACTLTLAGTVPMVTKVTVPSTGADIRCTVRGGRMSCG